MTLRERHWQALERLRKQRDRDEREAEIAQCSCGAQVRKDSTGTWVHCGPCKETNR